MALRVQIKQLITASMAVIFLPLAMQMSSESKLLLVSVHGTALSSGRRIPTGVYEECFENISVVSSDVIIFLLSAGSVRSFMHALPHTL